MNAKPWAAAALSVGLSLAFAPSAAALIVVDPDDFAAGTDISTSFPGVTLSASGAGFSGAVFSAASSLASTPPNVFASSFPDAPLWGTNPGILFQADFANLTNFVSIDFIPDDRDDPATLSAFSSAGVLLASVTTPGTSGRGHPEIASISLANPEIAYVTAFSPNQNFLLDRLQYAAPIPEPGTLALLGLGLAGLVRSRRWRRT